MVKFFTLICEDSPGACVTQHMTKWVDATLQKPRSSYGRPSELIRHLFHHLLTYHSWTPPQSQESTNNLPQY
jgi:hypothetical protein